MADQQPSAGKNLVIAIIVIAVGFLIVKGCQPDKPNPPAKPGVVTPVAVNPLVGEWQFGASSGDTMIFRPDATFQVNVNGVLYNFGDYRYDFSVKPARLTIIPKKVYWFMGYPALPLNKGIIRFTDRNVVDIAFKISPGSRQIGSDFPETFEYPNVKSTLQRIR